MKKVFRAEDVKDYWENRWERAGIDERAFENPDIYPVKYADMLAGDANKILEAGCGTGRLYFHYLRLGKNIKAFDFSANAINNILAAYPDADVKVASITDLPYGNEEFDFVTAFGLFHGLEDYADILKGLKEACRVLTPEGKLMFSVRVNGIENDIIDHKTKTDYTKRNGKKAFDKFHKWQFDLDDVENLCATAGLKIDRYFYARNVSFLFKWDFFRHRNMKKKRFVESKARSKGFQLNWLGRRLDSYLHKTYPDQFSNIMVVIASKQ